MELDVAESFEMIDYTLATDWEKFIVALEGILRKWVVVTESGVFSEQVDYLRNSYVMRFHSNGQPAKLLDLMDSVSDFSSHAHPLSRWFGFSSFITIEGKNSTEYEEARLLLSSLIVAVNTTRISAPVFVPYSRTRPRQYVGYLIGSDVVCQFSCKAFQVNVLPRLEWLMRDFCQRMDLDSETANNVSVSVHCTWKLRINPHGGWQVPTGGTGKRHTEVSWGPDLDPISVLTYSTTCQIFAENGVSSLIQSPLLDARGETNPSLCSQWSLMAELDEHISCPMSDSMRMMLDAMSEAEGFNYTKDVLNAINSIDQRHLLKTMESFLLSAKLPLADEVNQMNLTLFSKFHPSTKFVSVHEQELDIKSAPPLTLLSSLCMYLLNLEGLAGIALVWQEFVKELRWHWDQFDEIPRTGYPAKEPYRYSKLLQRIQMLNWCISQRHERNEKAKRAALGGWSDKESVEFDSVSSGEELQEEGEEEKKNKEKEEEEKEEGKNGEGVNDIPAELNLPVRRGAKELLPKLKLLANDINMYVPHTQDQAFVTEDMMEEQQELLLSLGDDKQGSEMRAQMQSKSLLSDMQAFQAANPGCVLEDFVRWHSDKDWVASETKKQKKKKVVLGKQDDGSWIYREGDKIYQGKLSGRMSESGNLWQRLWKESAPVPISEQKPLIDHVREGERILHSLESMNPSELLRECSIIQLTSIHHMFGSLPCAEVPTVSKQLASFAVTLLEVGSALRMNGDFGPEDLQPCLNELYKLETVASAAASLLCKLNGNQDLVDHLLKDSVGGTRVMLDNELDRKLVVDLVMNSLYGNEEGSTELPPPNEREYLFRAFTDSHLPRRMHVMIMDNSVTRVAIAKSDEE